MNFKGLCTQLGEDTEKVRYWSRLLKQAELIDPKNKGTRYEFSDGDLNQFRKLKEYLSDGAQTATEALRLMKKNLSPAEAIERLEVVNRQLEQTQKKLLQLREDPWYLKVVTWFRGKLNLFRKA
ncbi:hypothetical protein HYR53_01835 [Candidatus Acetothermia bacterium]|nr:hypothetical protein [Candidatus Acetothermia bacterium]